MKSIRYLLGAAMLAMTSLVAFLVFSTSSDIGNSIAERERSENPEKRAEWELSKLVDPRTGKLPPNIRRKELQYAAALPNDVEQRAEARRRGDLSLQAVQQEVQWRSRGPWNVGGRTRALAIDVSNENIYLAGGVSGGMWRTENRGASWTKVTTPDQLHSVSCMAQDTRAGKRNVWYYGTGELRGNSAGRAIGDGVFRGDGIFKSTDGGRTWARLPSTVTDVPQAFDNYFDWIWNIALDATNPSEDELYAATIGAIHRSTDGGNTWQVVLPQGGRFSTATEASRFNDVAVAPNGVVYAAMSQATSSTTVVNAASRGLWRSTDGVTWVNITPPTFPSVYNRFVIGIAPSNPNVVYFLGNTPNSGFAGGFSSDTPDWCSLWRYTYLSGDGSGAGGRWENLSANLPDFGGAVGNFHSQTSYNLVVKVKPDDENVVFIGGTNLYRSTDGFSTRNNTTWVGGYATANNASLYANHHADQHGLAFLPSNPNVLISSHDGGVSRTNNCLASAVAWDDLSNGYLTTQFYSIAIDPTTPNDNVIVGGMQDNGTHFVNAVSQTAAWREINSGDGGYCEIASGKTAYYVSSQEGNVVRQTVDASGNVFGRTSVRPPSAGGFLFITPFALDPNNGNAMFFAGGTVVWRNRVLNQSGASQRWDSLRNINSANVTALAVSRTPANRLYYGTQNGRVYRLDNADVSTESPREITGTNFPKNAQGQNIGYVSAIAVDVRNADRLLVSLSNYNIISIYFSENGGASWTPVSGNLEQNPDGTGNGPAVKWVEMLPVGAQTVFLAGTTTGLYATARLDSTRTQWIQQGASTIGNVVIDMIKARESDGLVAVATHGNGVYTANITAANLPALTPIPLSATKDNGRTFTSDYRLAQNYPNPFNPSTIISYQLPTTSNVSLKVFDMLGREVQTLVNTRQAAGLYQVEFKPQNLSSGAYFYRLQASSSGSPAGGAGTQSFIETKKMTLVK